MGQVWVLVVRCLVEICLIVYDYVDTLPDRRKPHKTPAGEHIAPTVAPVARTLCRQRDRPTYFLRVYHTCMHSSGVVCARKDNLRACLLLFDKMSIRVKCDGVKR
jgi:hypothetical protein